MTNLETGRILIISEREGRREKVQEYWGKRDPKMLRTRISYSKKKGLYTVSAWMETGVKVEGKSEYRKLDKSLSLASDVLLFSEEEIDKGYGGLLSSKKDRANPQYAEIARNNGRNGGRPATKEEIWKLWD